MIGYSFNPCEKILLKVNFLVNILKKIKNQKLKLNWNFYEILLTMNFLTINLKLY